MTFFQNFNNDLVFNIHASDIYYWSFTTSYSTRAVKLSSLSGAVAVPQQVGSILFTPAGYLLALGCTAYDATAAAPDYLGAFDPLMLRWCNVDADDGAQPEVWQPTSTNTSGFFRLQSGSEIITASNTRQETLVWTDTALYSLQFLGTTEVFSQQLLSAHCSIMGPNAVASINNVTYWMGQDKFFVYSGRLDTLPCTLRQYVFDDINRTQAQIFFAGTIAQFNEVIWFYCSKNASEIDRYVIFNYAENAWYYGTMSRTAWHDAGITDYPVAAGSTWVYYHELGHDDGQPSGAAPAAISAYIQSADVDLEDGNKYVLLRRVIPDVNFTSSDTNNYVTGATLTPAVTMTIGVRNFPGAASSTSNASGTSMANNVTTTTSINAYTNQVYVRGRGRQMNFKMASSGVGVQWQLGDVRVDGRPDGGRS